MKIIFLIVILLAVLILGYLLGTFLPFTGFFSAAPASIKGSAKLEVKLLSENNIPLSGVEVDVAEKVGPPSKEGVVITDNNGIATFYLKPGNYFIFFNTSNFPANLQVPREIPIAVSGSSNSKTIIIKAK